MSRISTGNGDHGRTHLWSGEEVPKDDPRVEAYGTLDELQAFMGAARHAAGSPEVKTLLENLRHEVDKAAAELASADSPALVAQKEIRAVEEAIEDFEMKVPLKGFVVTGSTPGGSSLDLCRVVARRAERRAVRLASRDTVSALLLVFLNRLSDLLFLLSCYEDHREGKLTFRNKKEERNF
ncbi:cob(I)yrinic acid a,c-diamide adenosyltransferase [Candidatus Mcinerneyibacteriota bacterium]|nr:cob(I)yrinic acid a,c-diamide adenosyltransferase [Candidatus Mcinerneyibacteriota bacterium]